MSDAGHEGDTRSGGHVDSAQIQVGVEGASMETIEQYVEIARAETERGELVLRERRSHGFAAALELRANGVFVMDSQETGSERALARAGLELVADPRAVVVGGLGLGYTMHQVLADSRVEKCAVVEIEEDLVDWMRTGTVPHGPALLADQRVHIVVADIAAAFAEARPSTYDLVLLDVDNGPGYLVHRHNAELYDVAFLTSVRSALRAGGAVVIWSADPAPELQTTLRETFGNAEAHAHDVLLQDRDEHYWLHVARVASPT